MKFTIKGVTTNTSFPASTIPLATPYIKELQYLHQTLESVSQNTDFHNVIITSLLIFQELAN